MRDATVLRLAWLALFTALGGCSSSGFDGAAKSAKAGSANGTDGGGTPGCAALLDQLAAAKSGVAQLALAAGASQNEVPPVATLGDPDGHRKNQQAAGAYEQARLANAKLALMLDDVSTHCSGPNAASANAAAHRKVQDAGGSPSVDAANGGTAPAILVERAGGLAEPSGNLHAETHAVCGDGDGQAFAARNPNIQFLPTTEDPKVSGVVYLVAARNLDKDPRNGIPTNTRMIPVGYWDRDLPVTKGASSLGGGGKTFLTPGFGGGFGPVAGAGGAAAMTAATTAPTAVTTMHGAGDGADHGIDALLAASLNDVTAAVGTSGDGSKRWLLAGLMTCTDLTVKSTGAPRPSVAQSAAFLADSLPKALAALNLTPYATVQALKSQVAFSGDKLSLSLTPADGGDVKLAQATLSQLAGALAQADGAAAFLAQAVAGGKAKDLLDAVSQKLGTDCAAVGDALGGSDKAAWAKALGNRDPFGLGLPCAVLDGGAKSFKDLVAGLASDFAKGKPPLVQRLLATELVLVAANVMADDWFQVNVSCLPTTAGAADAAAPVAAMLPGRTGAALGGYFSKETPAQQGLYFNTVMNNIYLPLATGADNKVHLSDDVVISAAPYPQPNLLTIVGSTYLAPALGDLYMMFDTVTYSHKSGGPVFTGISLATDVTPLAAALSGVPALAPSAPADLAPHPFTFDVMVRSADSTCTEVLHGRSFCAGPQRLPGRLR